MITLSPTTAEDDCRCPECSTEPKGYLYETGDNLQVHQLLEPRQLTPTGFHSRFSTGRCYACGYTFHGFELIIVDADVDENSEFAERHFRRNLELEAPTRHFMAARGKMSPWRVEVDASPLGPVFHHLFGPYLIGMPVIMYGQVMLKTLWDEFRELSRREVP